MAEYISQRGLMLIVASLLNLVMLYSKLWNNNNNINMPCVHVLSLDSCFCCGLAINKLNTDIMF